MSDDGADSRVDANRLLGAGYEQRNAIQTTYRVAQVQ
jgi:hypothetical protein